MSAAGSVAPSGPSDPGLAGERTMLAWARMGLTLLGVPSALVAYSAGRSTLAVGAAGVAMALGLGVLVGSVRRQRVAPGDPAGSLVPAARLILLTGACVLMLTITGGILILS